MTLIVLFVFALLFVGLILFADDLDASRVTIVCRCGRRAMRCFADSGQTMKLEDELSSQCPWCRTHTETVRADCEASED